MFLLDLSLIVKSSLLRVQIYLLIIILKGGHDLSYKTLKIKIFILIFVELNAAQMVNSVRVFQMFMVYE